MPGLLCDLLPALAGPDASGTAPMVAHVGALVPEGLSPWVAAALVLTAGLTSLVTAAFGIGGGLILLALMAPVVPAEALVPVHAVIQLGSNAGRSIVLVRRVSGRELGWFVPGAALGVGLGGVVAVDVPPALLRALVGVFVLWTAWGRLALPVRGRGPATLLGGALSSILTMFVGATGPFVLALFRQGGLDKERLVATTAVGMTLQHGLKILAFGILGFGFGAWLPLMGAMVLAGLAGTWVGARILRRLPEAAFRRVLRWALTAVAVELLVAALYGLR